MTKSQQLAKLRNVGRGGAPAVEAQPGVDAVSAETFQAPPVGENNFALHLKMMEHLRPGYALDAAQVEIMEARGLKGAAYREKLARAMGALRLADAQAALTALAMCVALPAWAAVMFRCAGVL